MKIEKKIVDLIEDSTKFDILDYLEIPQEQRDKLPTIPSYKDIAEFLEKEYMKPLINPKVIEQIERRLTPEYVARKQEVTKLEKERKIQKELSNISNKVSKDININEFLKRTYTKIDAVYQQYGLQTDCLTIIRPQIICNDGLQLSVQASYGHRCNPKETLSDGNYTTVEVGLIRGHEDMLDTYGMKDDWVFSYVPVELLDIIIVKHGGIKKIMKIPNKLS